VAACQGGRLVVHFTNRKNAPFLFFHMTRDATGFFSILHTWNQKLELHPHVTFGIADKQGSDFLARARQLARHHLPHLICWQQMR
jgi:hypothetical protein